MWLFSWQLVNYDLGTLGGRLLGEGCVTHPQDIGVNVLGEVHFPEDLKTDHTWPCNTQRGTKAGLWYWGMHVVQVYLVLDSQHFKIILVGMAA